MKNSEKHGKIYRMRPSERVKTHLRQVEFSNQNNGLGKLIAKSILRNPYKSSTSQKTNTPFIFIHVPKTAGQTIEQALGIYGGHYPI